MERCLHNFDRYDELHYGFESESLRILYYDLPEQYRETYASYEYPRICLILEGEKSVSLNRTEHFRYDTSEFILLPPHTSVEMAIDRNTKALAIELSDRLIDKLKVNVSEELQLSADSPGAAVRKFHLCGEARLMTDPLARIKACLSGNPTDKAFLMDLAAQEMAYHLLKLESTRHLLLNASRHPIHRAIRDMQANLATIHHIKEIAASYNMSAAHFANQFKKVTGVTPHDYLTHHKMLLAKDFLREKSVTETAYDLGYENLSHFIGLFKRKFGVTPKQYQKSFLTLVQ